MFWQPPCWVPSGSAECKLSHRGQESGCLSMFPDRAFRPRQVSQNYLGNKEVQIDLPSYCDILSLIAA